jgi:Protein of unknown function (DUF3572)
VETELSKVAPPSIAEASGIALKLLEYMAVERGYLERFMALAGLSIEDVRNAAADPNFHGGILDFALSDESLLLAFTANAGLKPEKMIVYRSKLPGFAP